MVTHQIRGLIPISCLLVILIVSTTNASSVLRSDYDHPCNKTLRCKTQAWLSCDPETNKCVCARPDEMIFDHSRGKCVALIGERCKYAFDEEEDGYGVANPWYGKADCVQGATCGPSGFCSCPIGTFEDGNQCTPVKSYGEMCLVPTECNQDIFLNCVKGTCQCDPDNAVYNSKTFQVPARNDRFGRYVHGYGVPASTCIGRVGTRCSYSTGKYCIQNSKCDETTGKCICNDGYTETSERLCGLGYNQVCSATTICSDKLRCSTLTRRNRDGAGNFNQVIQCQCPNPKYQEYDTTEKVCRGFVRSPCDPDDTLPCVENAICSENKNTFRCECQEGYVDSTEGRCEIAHGYDCEYFNTNSYVAPSELCDHASDLRCKAGKCSCENEADIYEPGRRQCSTSVGFRCRTSEECVANSVCKKDTKAELWGSCECEAGFEMARNRTCTEVRKMDIETESESKEVLIELLEDALKNNMNSTDNNNGVDDDMRMPR